MTKIVVTGGSGRLGQFAVRELVSHGYEVLSLDRRPPTEPLCAARLADLRRSGDLYQALAGADGVIHLGAYQAPGIASDTETFGNNVTATYNVLKASADLGVKKVVIASSTAAFGFIYALKPFLPLYLPLDENHPCKPQDAYGLSKLVGEQIAASIAALRADMTICSLRFPGVVFDFTYQAVRERWKDPGARARTSWAYIDARDAARACRLAIESEVAGHQVIIAAAPTSSMREPTAELVRRYLGDGIPIRSRETGNWSGVDSTKAKELLRFMAEHLWEDFLQP
jgi:nucleoside-diphosphate-sugar epimerase